MNDELDIIVLAAGRGTRMRSDRAKVLHQLAGRPMLHHVLDVAFSLRPTRVGVVVGHQADAVAASLDAYRDAAALDGAALLRIDQAEQRGTGHAVWVALQSAALASSASSGAETATRRVLILYGDVPLLQLDDLQPVVDAADATCVVLGVHADDPTGYGRLLIEDERLVGIVEERDTTPEQKAIAFVNTGIMLADRAALTAALADLCGQAPANASGEYYLTDVIAAIAKSGTTRAVRARDAGAVAGVNDLMQLADAEAAHRRRVVSGWMKAGLRVADPQRIGVLGTLTFGRDCELGANVELRGRVGLGDRVRIDSGCILEDVEIGDDAVVHPYSVLLGAVVGPRASIGPFARLRPGTVLDTDARIGNFVETKNATVGSGSKVNHLSYVGDTTIGRDANLGAGTITCNYDGARKWRTEIGDRVFVGSNSALVAPLRIGTGATIAAGSVITDDVDADVLAIARVRQRVRQGWRRPGSGDSDRATASGAEPVIAQADTPDQAAPANLPPKPESP